MTCSLVVVVPLLVALGCAPLEQMAEPEVSDLELTVETMKTALRDAQRTVGDLRTDLDARRKELAEAQVAKAQLEGRVREAERRLLEARQVVELQRDELAAARNERERVVRTGRQLQGRLKQLRKQLTDANKRQQVQDGVSPAAAIPHASPSGTASAPRAEKASVSRGQAAVSPSYSRDSYAGNTLAGPMNRPPIPSSSQLRSVLVKPGDTLWRIALRHRVDLDELRTVNELADNNIQPGQALWLPVARVADRSTSSTDSASY